MKVLIISFGTFIAADGSRVEKNIGQKISARILADWTRSDCQLLSLHLPANPKIIKSAIKKMMGAHVPNFIFCLGHAKGYQEIIIETSYFNNFVPRLQSEKKHGGTITSSGQWSYQTNFKNLYELIRQLNIKGIPSALHSGLVGMDYLCNLTAYLIHFYVSQRKNNFSGALLLHVPPEDTMPINISLAGVKKIINSLI